MFIRLLLFFVSLSMLSLEAFEKVVIWGHKLHTHTHSYIHDAFYKTFRHLGYETYWFDNSDDVSGFDFANTLFLTEGQVDDRIPMRNDCDYMLHNWDPSKYTAIDPANRICFQVYTHDVFKVSNIIQLDDFIYWEPEGQCLFMPWATDLLPEEIEACKMKLPLNRSSVVYWVGTIGEGLFGNKKQIDPFIQACRENGLLWRHLTGLDVNKSVQFIQESYLAPTIVGQWQLEKGYIPCRIFKNVSYGQLGITNSATVNELFKGKIAYHPDSYQLFYVAKSKLETHTNEDQIALMDFIKEKHTYVNRINTLLYALNQVKEKHAKRN